MPSGQKFLGRNYKTYKCLICDLELKTIGKHLKTKHNLTYKDYYDLYLKKENEGLCFSCGLEAKFDYRHHYYNEYCDACFELTVEERYNIYKRKDDEGWCKSCRKQTKWNESRYNKYCDDCYNRQAQMLSIVHSPEFREARSIAASEQLKNPLNKFGKPSRSWAIAYEGITFKSSWEAEFAQLCDKHSVQWQYEPKTFKLSSGKRYTPDFYLSQYDLWVEIKPEYRLSETEIPTKEFENLQLKYVVVTEQNRKSILNSLQ